MYTNGHTRRRTTGTIDLTFDNAAIPAGQQTSYWWRGFAPKITQRTHVIGFQVIIPDGELATTHHMLLYHCPAPLSAADLAYVGNGHVAETPMGLQQCNVLNPIAG